MVNQWGWLYCGFVPYPPVQFIRLEIHQILRSQIPNLISFND